MQPQLIFAQWLFAEIVLTRIGEGFAEIIPQRGEGLRLLCLGDRLGGIGGDKRVGFFGTGIGSKTTIRLLECFELIDGAGYLLAGVKVAEALPVGLGEGLYTSGDREFAGGRLGKGQWIV